MARVQKLGCNCGKVTVSVSDGPITSAECCCNSCRTAAETLQKLPGAPQILTDHGSVRYELYRKDRMQILTGAEHLQEYRLSPEAKTRRIVATCCNTPMLLEFRHGHWVSTYGNIWPEGTLPPLEMRTMTSDLPDPSVLPGDVPNASHQGVGFFIKLLGAWIAMGFRVPKFPDMKKLEI